MSLRINSNISAMNTHRQLASTDKELATSIERLSSGLRINRAADDSAGLAISQRLDSQVSGLEMASQNASQATNMVQTAEGFLTEVHNMLGRMRELAVQSASDTLTDSDRASTEAEFTSLRDEIDRIASSAEYNNTSLLDGTFSNKQIQVGANGDVDNQITISIDAVSSAALGISASSVDDLASATTALTDIDNAIDTVSEQRSALGTIQNRLAYTISSVDNASENLASSASTIRDLDISSEMTQFTKSQILQQSGMSMLAQANSTPQNVLSLFQ